MCLQHVCSPPVVLAAMFTLVNRQGFIYMYRGGGGGGRGEASPPNFTTAAPLLFPELELGFFEVLTMFHYCACAVGMSMRTELVTNLDFPNYTCTSSCKVTSQFQVCLICAYIRVPCATIVLLQHYNVHVSACR